MRRFTLILLGCAGVLSGLFVSLLHGQISDADKKRRDAFLKAREEMRTVASPTPSESATPAGKPKPAKKKGTGKGAKTDAKKSPTPKKATPVEDEEDESPSPSKRKKGASPSPVETPRPSRRPDADDAELPKPEDKPSASAAPSVAPSAPPSDVNAPPPDIRIQKSGLEQDQGFEPPPPPPPRRGLFARLFGRGSTVSYRYLSRGVIDAIRRAPVQRARWKFVIVHNSGTRQGNARAFDYYHRRVRKMKNGMAYHFVVGNGTSSGNGQVEIGERWRRQINGGHVHSDYLNNISLGICLVGDFNRDRPTKAQLEATEELVKYLRERCGKADGRVMGVRPHREMNPPRWATDCPGDAFPYAWFRRF